MYTEDRTQIDTATVARTNELVTQTGILDMFERWRAQDNVTARPSLVSDRALLVGLMLLAKEQSPLSLALLADLLHRRLDAASMQLLDLPAATASEEAENRNRSLRRTQTSFHRMLALMNPYPDSTSARSFADISALLRNVDVAKASEMKGRLEEFTDAFILMTVAQQPPRLGEASPSIDVAIDELFIPSPMRTGFSLPLDRRVAEEAAAGGPLPSFRPVDVFAGWSRTDGTGEAGRPVRGTLAWGWMTTIAVRVDSETGRDRGVPLLVLGATLGMPGQHVADAAVRVMRSAVGTGLTPGIVHASRHYFGSQPIEHLHLPTMELGFTPVTEYPPRRLGVNGHKNGAVFIEGKAYCPDMPPSLRVASIDFRSGNISAETYYRRLQARENFELRPMSGPDSNGRYRMAHPAPHGLNSKTHPSGTAGKACAQKSVTFERTDGLSHRQALPYMSREWVASRAGVRSTLEAFHEKFRNHQAGRSGSARRVAGFAAAQVLTTIELVEYNLQVLDRFLRENSGA